VTRPPHVPLIRLSSRTTHATHARHLRGRAAWRRSGVAAVALVLGGCGPPVGAPASVVAPTTPAASPAPDERPVAGPDSPVLAPIVSDWVDAVPVALAGGASVAPCTGDALMLCVTRDGADLGILELATFEVPAELAAATDRPSLDAALRSWAAGHLAWVEDDRRAGCGDDHTVARTTPVAGTLGGVPGVRTGFEVRRDGVLVEKVVTWVTVRDDTLVIVGADAARTGSCMAGGDLVLWQPDDLVEHLDELDRVVAGTPLPG
jgi:hypothetical protein